MLQSRQKLKQHILVAYGACCQDDEIGKLPRNLNGDTVLNGLDQGRRQLVSCKSQTNSDGATCNGLMDSYFASSRVKSGVTTAATSYLLYDLSYNRAETALSPKLLF